MYSDKKMNGIGGDIAEESKFLAKIWDILIGLGFLEPGWDKDCCVDVQLLFWNLCNILRSGLARIC